MNISDISGLERNATRVAVMLHAMANPRRLMLLCELVEHGQMSVTALADAVGLSQSALSQHLARLREAGIVNFRRDRQVLLYRISDPRTEELLSTLHRLYCTETDR